MAITFTDQDTPDKVDGTDAASYASSSWTPPNELIILFVFNSKFSGASVIPTVSGNSLTWFQIATVSLTSENAGYMRCTLFGANGSGATDGVTTFDFAGETQMGIRAFFMSASGTDVANGVVQSFIQAPTGTVTSANSISIALSAAGNSENRPVAGFANDRNNPITPRTNWTEMDEITSASGFDQRAETQVRTGTFETTASASGSEAGDEWIGEWIGIAAEIKAPAAAVFLPPKRFKQAINRASTY